MLRPLGVVALCSALFAAVATAERPIFELPPSLWGLEVKTLDGKPAGLSQYRGKVALVVNVASAGSCAPQYKGLQALQDQLPAHDFVVLAFPSNDFAQEPGDAATIKAFCEQYKVTFPLFEKCHTNAGPDQSPVYRFLGAETKELPGWSFCKYIVGRNGLPTAFFPSQVAPDAPELRKAIDAALAVREPRLRSQLEREEAKERRKTADGLARMMFEAVKSGEARRFSGCLINNADGRFLYGPNGESEAKLALQVYSEELWRPRAEKLRGAETGTFTALEGEAVQGKKGLEIRDAILVYTTANGTVRKVSIGHLVQVEDGTWKAHRVE